MDTRKTNKKLTKDQSQRVRKVTETTPYDTCSEALSSFGGLLPLVKFLDLIRFKDHFDTHFKGPERTPVIGHYRMILGLVTLLFVGFQRLGHFEYIRFDPMICGILKISLLPVVSTFWRYLQSLNMHHCKQLLFLQSALRKESWALRGFRPSHITVDIDTTVSTVYGDIQGAHKGHNNNHRGKEALRPVLCVIAQTGEFLCGAQRKGKTISSKEVSKHVSQFKQLLPNFIKTVLVRADGEFMGSTCIETLEAEKMQFIIGNRRCAAQFPERGWYSHGKYEYNEVMYQPTGWKAPYRFVVMRISKEEKGNRQLPLLEEDRYMHRVFVTNLKSKPHKVITLYDGRANAENAIKEAQQEGIQAIPSKRYQSNSVFFQLVMLNYNLWHWMKAYFSFVSNQDAP